MKTKFGQKLYLIGGTFLIATITFLISWFVAKSYNNGAFVNWDSIGMPPEIVKSFEMAGFDGSDSIGYILVRSQNGELYQGSKSLCLVNSNCWEKVDNIPSLLPLSEFNVLANNCPINDRVIDDLPYPISFCAYYEDEASGSHLIRKAQFALLNDGSVWVWEFIPGMGAFFILGLGVISSIFSAILFSLIISLRRR